MKTALAFAAAWFSFTSAALALFIAWMHQPFLH